MMTTQPLRLGIAGAGTVGASVLRLLAAQHDLLQQRAGRAFTIQAVSSRSPEKFNDLALGSARIEPDVFALAVAPDIDCVVELIGGSEGAAKTLVETALRGGKHVVTANKALLAQHGYALALLAEKNGVTLAFEAAVAGGVPIIKALREGAAANAITRVFGILNGTCNYILTQLAQTGRPFAAVLSDAQRLGYAEADPSFDIDGVDAGHKLAILASLAFGTRIDFSRVSISGIRALSDIDSAYAAELGYAIKLLGYAEPGVQRVSPLVVPLTAAIAHVNDVFNAVVFEGDYVGQVMIQGRGAGGNPTASAVVADLVDIAANRSSSPFGMPAAQLQSLPVESSDTAPHEYYVRFMVNDRPGVVSAVAGALAEQGISIKTLQQRAAAGASVVPLLLTTYAAEAAALLRAVKTVETQGLLAEAAVVLPLLVV
ncbi:MAG: homoserine dehydrogenase [Holosporales bacterium]